MMKLNAATRLQAGEIIAPSESFRGENRQNLHERQSESQRYDDKADKETKVKSASTPESKSPADTADVMYAKKAPLFAHFRLIADRLMTEDDPLTTDMENACTADSTTVSEDPFPVEHDAQSTHEGNDAIEVIDCRATSTHDQSMMLESGEVLAESTHGMDKFKITEHKPQESCLEIASNTALARLTQATDPGSTAQDNVTPMTRIVGDDVDENYLNVRGTPNEQNADADPAMFGNGTQPLGGIGG
jgi:hypothetical protein